MARVEGKDAKYSRREYRAVASHMNLFETPLLEISTVVLENGVVEDHSKRNGLRETFLTRKNRSTRWVTGDVDDFFFLPINTVELRDFRAKF